MKKILLFATATAFLTSCSAVHELSGRVVTKESEFIVLPDGRIEITVNPDSGK